MDMSQAIKEAGRKASRDDMTPREKRALDMIAYRVGRGIQPTNAEVGSYLGVSPGTAEQVIHRLRIMGAISFTRVDGRRHIEIIKEMVEPERVDSWTCPRCGARSGNCAHTAVALSSRDIPAWRAM